MERVMRRAGALVVAVAVLVGCLTALAPVVSAQVDVQWRAGSATVDFGSSIEFRQEISVAETPVRRVELLVLVEGDPGPRVQEVQNGGTLATSVLTESYDLTENHIYFDTDVVAQFRITVEDGSTSLGPEITLTYLDDRFEWRVVDATTPAGTLVRVHWYEGSETFARRALDIALQGLAKSEARLGVSLDEPVDAWIYPDQAAYLAAYGPGGGENTGGFAVRGRPLFFGLIEPGSVNAGWVESLIPHELAHLVFHTAIENPYHEPPRWLNEGLAVYEADGYTAGDRQLVRNAIEANSIIPLWALSSRFPTPYAEFALAYAEGVSAVDFLIRAYGNDALVRLIRSYADGITDDEAFEAAIGMTVAEFDEAWQRELAVEAPTQYGPQPPPPGPLPSGWSRVPEAAAPPTPEPSAPATAGPTAAPTAAPTPAATAAPTIAPTAAPATTPPSPAATPAASQATGATASPASPSTTPIGGAFDGRTLGLALGGLAVVLGVVGIGLIVNSRRTPAGR